MAKTIDGRLAYADLLRAFATLAVVILHISSGWISQTEVGSSAWRTFNLYNGLTLWCVPVFIMLSGMFMLDPKKEITKTSLCLRHILRILTALFFWGILYAAFDYGFKDGQFTLAGVLDGVKHVLWSQTHYHLWFLYAIIGLYLVTPILRAFVKGASRSDFHWFFLLVFVFACVLPLLLQLRPSTTLANWRNQLQVYLVTGYVGCYVAGYYLKTYPLGRIAEFLIYLLGAAGVFVTVAGTEFLSRSAGTSDFRLYAYMSPNVCATAVAVFVLFRYVLGVSEERGRRQSLGTVARVSFGIYLCHDFFITLLRVLGISTLSFLPALSVPVLALGVFACAFAVSWLLNKIPFLGRYLS